MIKKRTYNDAASAAKTLASKGISIDEMGNTPLMDISRMSGLGYDFEARRDDNGFMDMDMPMLMCDKSENHETTIKSINSEMIESIDSQINLMRSTVIPLIKRTLSSCESAINNVNDEFGGSFTGGWRIVKTSFPEFLLNSMFALDYDLTKGRVFELPTKIGLLPYKEKQDITKLIMTGDSDIDPMIFKTITELNEYFKCFDACFIECVWFSFFCKDRQPVIEITESWLKLINPLTAGSVVSIVYLLAKNLSVLLEDDPLAPEGYDTADGGKKCIALSKWAILRTNSPENANENYQRSNAIVISVLSEQKIIAVRSESYDEWIDSEENTNIDIIGTVLVSGKYVISPDTIKSWSDRARDTVNKLIAVQKSSAIINAKQKLKRLISQSLRIASIKDLSAIEIQYHEDNPDYISIANEKINKIITTVNDLSIERTAFIIERCVTEGRFYFCDSDLILESIRRNSGEMSPEEAEIIARIEYSIKWLVSQMRIVNEKSS